MAYFVITLTTILVVTVLTIRNIKNNKNLLFKILRLIKEVNATYLDMFKQGRIIKIGINLIMVVFAEILTYLYLTTLIFEHISVSKYIAVEVLIKILISILVFIVIYYTIGYILLFSSKIHGFLRKTEDENFKTDFILSYFIISTYLATMIIFPKQFNKVAIIALVGVVISYYLNVKILISLMINPKNSKSVKEEGLSYSRLITAAILILVMIVLNLYLAVCIVNSLHVNSFSNVNGNFSLFYYTIITFTTIGYGDIIPLTLAARILSIIISITSVVCLTIFLSSVFSYKDEFKK